MTATTGAGLRLRGSGCAAADLDGNGATDLFVTTAGYDAGRDAYDARALERRATARSPRAPGAPGVRAFGWHTGAAVADVNGDGRLDVFVAGYTDLNGDDSRRSSAGFPANHRAVRDLLYLNEGGPTGFREVGAQAGLEPRRARPRPRRRRSSTSNRDGRLDLYVANDLDPNRLYLNVARPDDPRGARLPLRRARSRPRRRRPERGDGRRRRRLLRRRARRPPRDELARAAARRVRGREARAVRRRSARLRAGARAGEHGLGSHVGRPRPRRRPGARDGERRDPGDEPRPRRRAPPAREGSTASEVEPLTAGGVAPRNGRGLAAADYDNDGDLDLAVGSIGGRLQLLRNDGADGHWLEVAGLGPGPRSRRRSPTGEGSCDGSTPASSYLSSEDPRVHLGLGDAAPRRAARRAPPRRPRDHHARRRGRPARHGTRARLSAAGPRRQPLQLGSRPAAPSVSSTTSMSRLDERTCSRASTRAAVALPAAIVSRIARCCRSFFA